MAKPIKDMTDTELTEHLCERLKSIRDQKKALKQELSMLSEDEERAENSLLTLFEKGGTTSIRNSHGTFYIKTDFFVSMPDPEAGHRWLRDTGHGSLIKEVVNPQTLRGAVKQFKDNGEEIADVFKVTERQRVGRRG